MMMRLVEVAGRSVRSIKRSAVVVVVVMLRAMLDVGRLKIRTRGTTGIFVKVLVMMVLELGELLATLGRRMAFRALAFNRTRRSAAFWMGLTVLLIELREFFAMRGRWATSATFALTLERAGMTLVIREMTKLLGRRAVVVIVVHGRTTTETGRGRGRRPTVVPLRVRRLTEAEERGYRVEEMENVVYEAGRSMRAMTRVLDIEHVGGRAVVLVVRARTVVHAVEVRMTLFAFRVEVRATLLILGVEVWASFFAFGVEMMTVILIFGVVEMRMVLLAFRVEVRTAVFSFGVEVGAAVSTLRVERMVGLVMMVVMFFTCGGMSLIVIVLVRAATFALGSRVRELAWVVGHRAGLLRSPIARTTTGTSGTSWTSTASSWEEVENGDGFHACGEVAHHDLANEGKQSQPSNKMIRGESTEEKTHKCCSILTIPSISYFFPHSHISVILSHSENPLLGSTLPQMTRSCESIAPVLTLAAEEPSKYARRRSRVATMETT